MKKSSIFLLILFFLILNISCKKNYIQTLNENELFTIQYGRFEEDLSVSDLNKIGNIRLGLCMKDGFFYIVNGESKKIMELNSYGDLLSLYYNEDSETESLINNSNAPKQSIHHQISFPFDYQGLITADSNKNIYVVCSIPFNRQEQNEDETMLYSQNILKISRDGSFIEYIGQQGPGGTPFPLIKNIYTTSKNELVVVAISTEGPIVYWFSEDGFLKFMIPLQKKDAPKITDSNNNEIYLSIENVIPDKNSYTLYVQINYFSSYVDEDSKVMSGINFLQSNLYTLQIQDGIYSYEDSIVIPPYEENIVAGYSRLTYQIPYDFLGITKNGWKFFIVRTQDGFNVEMLQNENQRILRRQFKTNHHEIFYDTIFLSDEGILCAMYLQENGAKVAWYRTDNLIDAILKK